MLLHSGYSFVIFGPKQLGGEQGNGCVRAGRDTRVYTCTPHTHAHTHTYGIYSIASVNHSTRPGIRAHALSGKRPFCYLVCLNSIALVSVCMCVCALQFHSRQLGVREYVNSTKYYNPIKKMEAFKNGSITYRCTAGLSRQPTLFLSLSLLT